MDSSQPAALEVYISRGGRYLGASDGILDVLGYTEDDLRALPFGALSGSSPEAADRVWRSFVDDGLQIPANASIRLYTRTGRRIAARFLGSERLDDERWVSRYRLLTGRAVATDQPFVLQSLLAQWRELERRLAEIAAIGSSAPERSDLETHLAEIRALYQHEQQRRRTPEDALP